MADTGKKESGLKTLLGAAVPVAKAGTDLGVGAARTGNNVVGFFGNLANNLMGTAGNLAQRFPKLTFLAATYGSIKGVQSIMRKRKERNEAQEAAQPTAYSQQTSYTPPGASAGFGAQGFAAGEAMPSQPRPPEAQATLENALSPADQAALMDAIIQTIGERQQGAAPDGPATPSFAEQHARQQAPREGGWANQVDASRQQPAQGQNAPKR